MVKLSLLIFFIISLMNGCSTVNYPEKDDPPDLNTAPVDDASSQSSSQTIEIPQPRVITTAMAEQAHPAIARKKSTPPSRRAVLDLLAQSKEAIDQSQYDEAEGLLKRALRIEPGNAWLWHNMAVLKFYQADYEQAIQQALKSNNLEKNDAHLKANNFKIIKQSYIEIGDLEKAENY